MNKSLAKALIDVAMGRSEADLCLMNANVVDVYNKEVFKSDVYIKDGYFCTFSPTTKAKEYVDLKGKYLIPGFIDGHCHIESSHLSPSAFSDAVVPCGTTSVIADPHEICNVAGLDGLSYMLSSSEKTPLSVFLMVPSCVPATDAESSGAILLAKDIESVLNNPRLLGLGEMMNYPGVVYNDDKVIDKLECCYKRGKNIDGHAPAVNGKELDAYAACRITTDHECATPEELHDRIRRGMYVQLRQGTACKNVLDLLPGVNKANANRVMFCTDDRQPQTIKEDGHINHGVNLAIQAGFDPIYAISMATLSAATCYHLEDRGAIAPGLRADCFISQSLENIKAEEVFILGESVAKNGVITKKAPHVKPEKVEGMMNIGDFREDKLRLHLNSDHVRVIDIIPGGVVTGSGEAYVKRDKDGYFVHDDNVDILKLAVVERHHGTGNVGLGLIRGYGMKDGAVATSIAHDSHNIIVVGSNDRDMALAIKELVRLGGGITMVKDGKVIASHRLEIGGLMTDDSAEEVCKTLEEMHSLCDKYLQVNKNIDPFMTLCFMALPVIPELKLTDKGLFDVTKFSSVPIEL